MLKRVASSVNVFLILLLTLTVQADDVSIRNAFSRPVQFRVMVPSTGYDRTVTLQPRETQNAIGTDLWHNARVIVIGLHPEPENNCYLIIDERNIASWEDPDFYLPEATAMAGRPACPYTTNVPPCGCFIPYLRTKGCFYDCTGVSNAQVFVHQ